MYQTMLVRDRLYRPAMDITEMKAEGSGPSKRDAKHNAAEAMAHVLLPQVHFYPIPYLWGTIGVRTCACYASAVGVQ